MTRKIKTLVPVALAALAAAVAAPAVHAEPMFSTENEEKATLDGTSIEGHPTVFKLGEMWTVTCEKTGISGTLQGTSSTLTIGRSYEKCTAVFGGAEFPATFTLNGCAFELHLKEQFGEVFIAQVDIPCEEEFGLEIHIYKDAEHKELKCTFEIPPQNGLERVEIENGGGMPNDLVIRPNVESIKYKLLAGGLLACGFKLGAEGADGIYMGATTTTGTNEKGKQIGLFVS